ncbi:MAG: SLBB domain-containing protein [Kiritimatiellaeota bacterium]|nr:SLBB domain-containing protein [Kiritimatiellota bacterium]
MPPTIKHWKHLIASGLCLLMLAGCQTTVTAPAGWRPDTDEGWPEPERTDVLRPREMVTGNRVTIELRVPGIGMREDSASVIDERGMVPLPIIDLFKIADMTPSEAGQAIAHEYIQRQIYKDLVVNVINLSNVTLAEEYFITGEVKNQAGRFPLTPGLTLRQAIIAAGNVTDYASDTVWLTRGKTIQEYSRKKLNSLKVHDPVLRHGDTIKVDRAWL